MYHRRTDFAVCTLCRRPKTRKVVAVTDQKKLHIGIARVQARRNVCKLHCRLGAVCVHAADADNPPCVFRKRKFSANISAVCTRCIGLGVDAVDGHGNVVGTDAVIVDEVLLDIVADSNRPLTPARQKLPEEVDMEVQMCRRDKPHMILPAQQMAQQCRNACVCMNDVKAAVTDESAQDRICAQHADRMPRVQRRLHMADAVCRQRVHKHAAR